MRCSVATVIGQAPGTGYDLFSYTCSVGYNIGEGCIQRIVTVICLICHITGYSCRCIISAAGILEDRYIGRDSKGRSCIVSCSDDLNMRGRIATIIGQTPGTGYYLFSDTCSVGYYIRKGCIKSIVAVICLIRYIAGYTCRCIICTAGILEDRYIGREL